MTSLNILFLGTLLNGLIGRTVFVGRLDDVDPWTHSHKANGIYKEPVMKVDEKMLMNSKPKVHKFFIMACICICSEHRFGTDLPPIDQSDYTVKNRQEWDIKSSEMSDCYYNGFSDGIQKEFETAVSIWLLVFNMNLSKFVNTYTEGCTQVFVSQDMADTTDMPVVRGLKI